MSSGTSLFRRATIAGLLVGVLAVSFIGFWRAFGWQVKGAMFRMGEATWTSSADLAAAGLVDWDDAKRRQAWSIIMNQLMEAERLSPAYGLGLWGHAIVFLCAISALILHAWPTKRRSPRAESK